jgi:hypothetical protein
MADLKRSVESKILIRKPEARLGLEVECEMTARNWLASLAFDGNKAKSA